jgi:hypothetical protein
VINHTEGDDHENQLGNRSIGPESLFSTGLVKEWKTTDFNHDDPLNPRIAAFKRRNGRQDVQTIRHINE